jgi:hypothetical protein
LKQMKTITHQFFIRECRNNNKFKQPFVKEPWNKNKSDDIEWCKKIKKDDIEQCNKARVTTMSDTKWCNWRIQRNDNAHYNSRIKHNNDEHYNNNAMMTNARTKSNVMNNMNNIVTNSDEKQCEQHD